ncbi:hypothetical protein L9G74_21930, partial [Shewanella sp. C32]
WLQRCGYHQRHGFGFKNTPINAAGNKVSTTVYMMRLLLLLVWLKTQLTQVLTQVLGHMKVPNQRSLHQR